MSKKKIFNKQAILSKLPLLAICFTVIGGCWYALFNHYQNMAKGTARSDLVYKLESSLLDLRFQLRGEEKPKKKVGVLAIDEKSIQQFGRFPFSRRYYERAFQNLKKAGVDWIGFDVIFSEHEVPTLSDAKPYLEMIKKAKPGQVNYALSEAVKGMEKMDALAPGDASFARGIKEFENVILGFFYMQTKYEAEISGRLEDPFKYIDTMEASEIEMLVLPDEDAGFEPYKGELTVAAAVMNIPELAEATDHFAFFSNNADEDAIVRWASLVRIIDDRVYPSLALKTAAEALNRDIVIFFNEIGIEAISLINREDDSDAIDIPIDFYGRGRILINHKGSGYNTFPHISLADAWNDSFSEEAREFLKGSVLLLGATAIGTNDQRPNPFDPALDGVENHAAVVDNIMAQDFMKRLPEMPEIEMALVLGIGLLFSPILVFSRALFAGLAAVIFCVAYYFFDQYQWFSEGVWAYMAMPYIEIFVLFVAITLYKYATEEAEKKKVKGAFSHYLSPDVMEQVLADPDSLSLGGERKELTVFFSDVRGFTTISESLTPEQLTTLMNDYFTPMEGIIFESKGTLDKYIGDAIMAFWGAPVDLPDHADIAAESCIKMLFELKRLQADFKQKNYPHVDIGIGLNSGPMSVGNMGSDRLFQYTVMGDAVNLGSRLEGMTKNYGIRCMISEGTVKAFQRPEAHIVRDLDDIRVKGKNEPVKVFELMQPDYLPKPESVKELVEIFEAARIEYRNQNWEKAEKLFMDCVALNPEDGPGHTYLKRIIEMKKGPYIENWDGVTRYETK